MTKVPTSHKGCISHNFFLEKSELPALKTTITRKKELNEKVLKVVSWSLVEKSERKVNIIFLHN